MPQNDYDSEKKFVMTFRRDGAVFELRDPAGLTYLTVWPIENMKWDLTHKSDKIHAHMCKGGLLERKEVYKRIPIQEYREHNRMYYHKGDLYACIESTLIGKGR